MEKLTTTEKIKLIELTVEFCKMNNDNSNEYFALIYKLFYHYATNDFEITKENMEQTINEFFGVE